MKTFAALLAFCSVMGYSIPLFSACRPTVIAVLDTGFGYNGKGLGTKLCDYGHKNFTKETYMSTKYNTKDKIPLDINSHGTNVIGIIDGYAKKSKIDYCIVVIKYYSDTQTGQENLDSSTKAIQYANKLGVNIINYSGGGSDSSIEEILAVKSFLDRHGTFVAAAGNNSMNLDIPGNVFYPAMDDNRVIVVGNSTSAGARSYMSNYGKVVTRWEKGENVSAYGIVMTGTSQSTAVASGKILSERKRQCDIGF